MIFKSELCFKLSIEKPSIKCFFNNYVLEFKFWSLFLFHYQERPLFRWDLVIFSPFWSNLRKMSSEFQLLNNFVPNLFEKREKVLNQKHENVTFCQQIAIATRFQGHRMNEQTRKTRFHEMHKFLYSCVFNSSKLIRRKFTLF